MERITPTGGLQALQSARTGINRALAGLRRDAATVAGATAPESTGEIVTALVDARQQGLLAKASARIVSAADEMIGSLLNIRA